MQKLTLVLAFLFLLASCSEESLPTVKSAPEPNKSEQPIAPKPEPTPVIDGKYEVLRRDFSKLGLLCEESQKTWCFVSDEREYTYHALLTLTKALKLNQKVEILEAFEKFVDLESRTLYPKEKL